MTITTGTAAKPGDTPAIVDAKVGSGRVQVPTRGRVLLVDDDPTVLRSFSRSLRRAGFDVETAADGQTAVKRVDNETFDVILSDIAMPGMSGIQLLREVREHDLHVPVILVTGDPAVRTAVQALEYGAFHYLTKPVESSELESVVEKAVQLRRMAQFKEQAAALLGNSGALGADRAGLEASLRRAMETLWMAYQPVVSVENHKVFGYEALLRSDEPSLPHPGAVIDAADRLGRLDELGRTIRARATEPFLEPENPGMLFVNLNPTDLLDAELWSPHAPLSSIANRVVLEITERASLDAVKDVRQRVATLRDMGFRIAVDDLGAGYAGLTSFALLEPEIVKLDMSLVRDIHITPTKQKIVRSMTALSKDMGMLVVAEGVENAEERDTLIELGCDLLQGFFLARPGRPFPEVAW